MTRPDDQTMKGTRGGADLECALLCPNLEPGVVPGILGVVAKHGFSLRRRNSLLAYGADPIEPVLVARPEEATDFVTAVNVMSPQRIIVNFAGALRDVETELSFLLEFRSHAVVVSFPENALWGSSGVEHADFSRLMAFASLCEEIAAAVGATHGSLGAESYLPPDLAVERAEEEGFVALDARFFSREHVKELFDWYVEVYAKRPVVRIRE